MEISNMKSLREVLSEQLKKSIEGEISPAVLNSQSNIAGKIISTIKTEIEYKRLMGNVQEMGFLIDMKDNEVDKITKIKELVKDM